MKKILAAILVVVLILSLGASAFADPVVYYAVRSGAPVFAQPNADAAICRTLTRGEAIVQQTVTASGWVGISLGGSTLGWVPPNELSSVPPCAHTWTDWVVQVWPTCVRYGQRTHTCTKCGEVETETTPRGPHLGGDWTVIVETTDHSAGVREHTCRVCGNVDRQNFDPEGTLRRNAIGSDVRELQELLVEMDYLKARDVDGAFGPATEKAVVNFQKDQGFNADGVAWPQTITRLHHNYGEWELVQELTRTEDGEMQRTCLDCGFVQHRYTSAEPCFARGVADRRIMPLQYFLKNLGYDCGAIDGAFGRKMEAAWDAFALDNGVTPDPDKLRASDTDLLVNAWLGGVSESNWKGEGEKDSPVNLVLTVTPAGEENGLIRYDWTLTNTGKSSCSFAAILFGSGAEHDFTGDNLVMAVGDATLKDSGGNRRSGSFTVSADWAEGADEISFCAVAYAGSSVWCSNTVVCSLG